ncbi:MAG TPA: hypothetical protein VIP09_16065 [Dehalococcoidia bacterium]|jgi:hypothetical protein
MRSRDLKPKFFRNQELAELHPYVRLLYIGLWCFVDRSGRCLDNSKLIKADVFPFENVPVEKHLQALTDHDFIERYEVDGKRYIWVKKFLLHQHPHPHEAESELPPSPGDVTAMSLQSMAPSQPMEQGNRASHQPLAASTLAAIPSEPSSHQPPATDDPSQERQGRLLKIWANRVGVLPPIALPEFGRYAAGLPEEWFEEAIDVTVAEADHPSWKFCAAVLKRCDEEQVPPRGKAKDQAGSVAAIIQRRHAR